MSGFPVGLGMPPPVESAPGSSGLPPALSEPDMLPESATAPGFKMADEIDSNRCWNCRHWDGEGRCEKFGNPASAMDTCDAFEASGADSPEVAPEGDVPV